MARAINKSDIDVFDPKNRNIDAILALLNNNLVFKLMGCLAPPPPKRCLRIIEHSAIFILIAGTYTPLTLGILRGAFGWTLFGIVRGLAMAGVVLKAFYRTAHPTLSTWLYLLMGWLLVIAVKPLFSGMPAAGLFLLIAGGLSDTAGVAFFATDSRVPDGHLIWHLFVIAGTICPPITSRPPEKGHM